MKEQYKIVSFVLGTITIEVDSEEEILSIQAAELKVGRLCWGIYLTEKNE